MATTGPAQPKQVLALEMACAGPNPPAAVPVMAISVHGGEALAPSCSQMSVARLFPSKSIGQTHAINVAIDIGGNGDGGVPSPARVECSPSFIRDVGVGGAECPDRQHVAVRRDL